MNVLQEYRILQKEITQIEAQIDKLDALAQSPRIANITGMPRSGRVSDGMDIAAKIADLRDKYYAKLGRLIEIRNDAEKILESMGIEERVIIRYRYIDGLSVKNVAELIPASESTVKRRIKNAMEGMKNDV